MPWKQTTLTSLWPATDVREPPLEALPPVDPEPTTPRSAPPPASKTTASAAQAVSIPPATILTGAKLPEAALIEPLTQSNLISFRRIFKTLLPVRYPDKTYAKILANEAQNQIARVVVWRDAKAPPAACSAESSRGVVVGAVCARVQPIMTDGSNPTPTGESEVYMQMLGVLAPYRTQGLASALMREVAQVAATEHGAKQVMAHVWEANEEALEWYRRRGFTVDEMVEDYYQQLKPRGARVVRKKVSVRDFL
jgi:N-alpha-acetyltransferase 50